MIAFVFATQCHAQQRPSRNAERTQKVASPPSVTKQNRDSLEGKWEIREAYLAGQRQEKGGNPQQVVVFRDGVMTLPGTPLDALSYQIDPTSDPSQITYTGMVFNHPVDFRGLFEHTDNTLKLVINEWPNGPRPTVLSPSEPEQDGAPVTHRRFVVLQRITEPLSTLDTAINEWSFSWHSSEVTGLAFTPDGNQLISTSLKDDRISWVGAGGNPSHKIGDAVGKLTGARSHAVAVSPDGMNVAIAGFMSTAFYEIKTSNELWRLETPTAEYSPPYVMALAFSPDGKWLATSGSSSKVGGPHGYKGGLITIRDAKSGKERYRFDDLSHASDSIAFSPDGRLFAAGTQGAGGELPEPGEVRIWGTRNGNLLHVWKVKDSVQAGEEHYAANGIAFSPDSRSLAVANSDGVIRIWDGSTGTITSELKGHRQGVRRVAFAPGGKHLASAGIDRTVRLWNAETGKQLKSFDVESPKINTLAFSPNGQLLVAGGGNFLRFGEVHLWALAD